MKEEQQVILSLGSNLGDKRQNISLALQELNEKLGNITQLSAMYRTIPWGFESENDFINCCVVLQTEKIPTETLKITQEIECKLGRKEKTKQQKFESRIIDIDILYYEKQIIFSQRLILPHPHLYHRKFVLIPLAEVMPDWKDPMKQTKVSQLLKECKDTTCVERIT